jgi:hypothetical protein
MATSKKLSVKDLAERLEIDPRDARKFLRAQGKGVGRGGARYEFTPGQVTALVKAYSAYRDELDKKADAKAEQDKGEAKDAEEKAA